MYSAHPHSPQPPTRKSAAASARTTAQASSSRSSSTRSSAGPVSVVHSLSNFGRLQAGSLPEGSMNRVRAVCASTSCDTIHSNAASLFDPTTLSLLQQSCPGVPTALMKLPDGFMLFAPSENNRILSIIKDSLMCLPPNAHPSLAMPLAPDGARTVFYSIASPPAHVVNHAQTVLPFRVVFHDGYTHAHEISRFCMADHAIAQLAAAIPLDTAPRVIMQSENLGTLLGQSLFGADADLIKQAFLGLVQQGGTGGVYDAPIETSQLVANLLQLKNKKGQISLGRLKDGIFGYRTRADGQKSFIFVANSDDFGCASPAPASQSQLHVYKMSYKDTSPTGLRIFVKVNPSACADGGDAAPSPCPYGTPVIVSGAYTVQNVLSVIELALRASGRDHAGCADFPCYCMAQAVHRAASGERMDPVMAEASRVVLQPPQLDPLQLQAAAAAPQAPPAQLQLQQWPQMTPQLMQQMQQMQEQMQQMRALGNGRGGGGGGGGGGGDPNGAGEQDYAAPNGWTDGVR